MPSPLGAMNSGSASSGWAGERYMSQSSALPWAPHFKFLGQCHLFTERTSFHSSFIYISAVPHLEKELLNFISQELLWLSHGHWNGKDIKDVSVILLVSFFSPPKFGFFFLRCNWDVCPWGTEVSFLRNQLDSAFKYVFPSPFLTLTLPVDDSFKTAFKVLLPWFCRFFATTLAYFSAPLKTPLLPDLCSFLFPSTCSHLISGWILY